MFFLSRPVSYLCPWLSEASGRRGDLEWDLGREGCCVCVLDDGGGVWCLVVDVDSVDGR